MAVGPTYFGNKTGNIPQAAAIADAGATYTAAEQASINAILAALRAAGIVAA